MAKQQDPGAAQAASEKQKLAEEKKKIKADQKEQRREAKRRAREISKQQEELEEDEESGGLLTVGATVLIVALWLAVIFAIVKLDVGGFGSNVLTPLLKDVPVLNKILPSGAVTETADGEAYGGYTSLKDAVEQIKALELELEKAQSSTNSRDDEVENLKAEVLRLQEFEKKQVDFQKIKEQFYNEVVYSDKGPGAEEFQKYYESMDPATAETLYKQVIAQLQEDKEIQDYAETYSNMKPKQAAGIFEAMSDNLELVSRILSAMSVEDRGAILGVMDAEVAARLTKIMDPEY